MVGDAGFGGLFCCDNIMLGAVCHAGFDGVGYWTTCGPLPLLTVEAPLLNVGSADMDAWCLRLNFWGFATVLVGVAVVFS